MKRAEVLGLSRAEVRYALYRVRTSLEAEGSEAAPEHLAVSGFYAKKKYNTGPQDFALVWDVGPEGDHDKVIKRWYPENAPPDEDE